MNLVASADGPGIGDNEVLDEFTIPFGQWFEQAINWTVNEAGWVLDIIEWPFEFLLDNVVDNFLVELPWWVVTLGLTLLALLVRNLTVASFTALALVTCGLLGDDYWKQTAITIGLVGVAVFLCVIVGIPIGILAGRVDSVWNVLRPVLDAMQVIHSFVYLLPFIYFFGVGDVGSTMATMIFAVPPLIRLTNLGVRQVPADVVEAARAYGAPEYRVLVDVQIPLAKPAILTGVNQTLLLAFSMLGVAAIMGAGGLGQLLFRALGQQDAALAASAGLAFYLLAVALDRIAQPSDGPSTSMLSRMVWAWRARNAPEVLLDDASFNPAADNGAGDDTGTDDSGHEGEMAEMAAGARTAIYGLIGGSVLGIVGLFLTWNSDSGHASSYSRRADEALPGESFSGLAASGGSWFGIVVLALLVGAIISALKMLLRPSAGGRWLAPDGAAFLAIGAAITAFAAVIARPSGFADGFSRGIGVYVTLLGAVIAAAACMLWLRYAPYGPRRPLKPKVLAGPIVLGSIAVVLAAVAMFSAWSFDERAESIITPEIQAELDEVMAAAASGEMEQGPAASEIQRIRAQAAAVDKIVIDGVSSEGAGLGIWALVGAALGLAALFVCAGGAGLGDDRRWYGGVVGMGFGIGVAGIAVGWIGSLARATDPRIYSGVGSFIALLAGAMLFLGGRTLVAGFERLRVYDDA